MNPETSSKVAIIPVRGGSTGTPRKNIRLLASKPLLWYIVQASKGARLIDLVVVSTEDEEITNFAKTLDVEVFRHPASLSTDTSPSFGVIQWALNELERRGINPEICVLLRATSPFCQSSDIDAALTLLESNPWADSVVSVSLAVGVHPIKLKRLSSDGRLLDVFGNEGGTPIRRQDLEPLYQRNAAIYVSKPELIKGGRLWGSNCLAYVMPEERSLNINTPFQFKLADLLMKELVQNSSSASKHEP